MGTFEYINTRYKGFRLTKIVPLPELKCTLRELVHEHSGAEVLHIENDDPENVFCLSFQTLPKTSDGVAHILEHTVLCGSKKFPIRDPFFAMSRRSLNTFMNALTGSDFTCYPAATQVVHDFYNLLDVYIDAVFHPNLKELSFKQEGHRLEFEIPDQMNTPLTIRGIVYNEMKGALNSSSARMQETLNQALFPNVTYGINSGGDPSEIPKLGYEELLQFHRTYYHPSRCLFYFYGNIPLANHLDFIEDRILLHTDKIAPVPPVDAQKRFSKPISIEGRYPAAPNENMENRTLISFGWLTCPILEQETCLALSILEIVLLDTDASPLKKALLKSGLCNQVSSFVETEISEVPFTIHLKGCNPESAYGLETVILITLQSLVENGIPFEAIENAIHQLEFYRSEITGDSHPFGFTLFFRSALLKQHGGSAENGLLIHTLFENIRRKCLQQPHYFTDLISKYLLNNPHRVRVTLTPDADLETQEALEEKNRLASIKKSLSQSEKLKLISDAKELKLFQQAQDKEDRNILPHVTLEDVPKKTALLPLLNEKSGPIEIYHHDCFTNEIGYVDLFFDLPVLTPQELMIARYMTVMLYQVGCGNRTYEQTLDYIQANTGGITPYLTLHVQADNFEKFQPAFALRGKALYSKMPKLIPLLRDLIKQPNFHDTERNKEILLKHYTGLASGLTQNALKYAINLSASFLNQSSYVANLWFGLDYYQMIGAFVKDIEEYNQNILGKLTAIRNKLCHFSPDFVLSSDKEEYERLKQHHFYGVQDFASQPSMYAQHSYVLPTPEHQGRVIASSVAFVAKVFQTVPYTHPDAPAINIASFLFDNLVLHKKIREEGGAYGGGAVSNGAGNFYFFSYRDPHIASTLLTFEEAIKTIQEGQFDAGDLEEAKLEMIQRLDNPLAPGSRGVVAYHWLREGKYHDEVRQIFRDRLLAVTSADVSQAVAKHIAPNFHNGTNVVFAGDTLLKKENEKLAALGLPPLAIKDVLAP